MNDEIERTTASVKASVGSPMEGGMMELPRMDTNRVGVNNSADDMGVPDER